jgi:hypothetical protein
MSPEEMVNRLLRFLSGEDEKPSWMHRQSGWGLSGPLYTNTNDSGNNPVKLAIERFDRAAVFTVQLGLNLGDTEFPVQCEAEIIWSLNGQPIRRVVSVSQGCSISGVTESIGVKLYDVTPLVSDGDAPPAPAFNKYFALASVAPGSRAATTLPPVLRAWHTTQALAASASTPLVVRRNAGVVGFRLSVWAQGIAGATVSMEDIAGTIFDTYIVNPGENSVFVPLAGGTTRLIITNNDTANAILLSGQWAIDG